MIEFDRAGLETYDPSEDLEINGIWLRFPGDRRFLVRRAGGSNTKYVRKLQHLTRPYKRQMDRGTIDPEVVKRLLREAYVAEVIIDWDGIDDKDGNAVPFTKKACNQFLQAFPDILDEIAERAGDGSYFSETMIEEAQETLGES